MTGNLFGGVQQNLILGPEAGQRENARQRQRPDDIQPEGDWHLLAQAAHVAHIARVEYLFVVSFVSLVLRGEPGDGGLFPYPG